MLVEKNTLAAQRIVESLACRCQILQNRSLVGLQAKMPVEMWVCLRHRSLVVELVKMLVERLVCRCQIHRNRTLADSQVKMLVETSECLLHRSLVGLEAESTAVGCLVVAIPEEMLERRLVSFLREQSTWVGLMAENTEERQMKLATQAGFESTKPERSLIHNMVAKSHLVQEASCLQVQPVLSNPIRGRRLVGYRFHLERQVLSTRLD